MDRIYCHWVRKHTKSLYVYTVDDELLEIPRGGIAWISALVLDHDTVVPKNIFGAPDYFIPHHKIGFTCKINLREDNLRGEENPTYFFPTLQDAKRQVQKLIQRNLIIIGDSLKALI